MVEQENRSNLIRYSDQVLSFVKVIVVIVLSDKKNCYDTIEKTFLPETCVVSDKA